jgi:hypothetical protein
MLGISPASAVLCLQANFDSFEHLKLVGYELSEFQVCRFVLCTRFIYVILFSSSDLTTYFPNS